MYSNSRREVLRNLAAFSAVGCLSHGPLAIKELSLATAPPSLPPVTANDFYLILTGAWLLSFDLVPGKVCAVTTDFKAMHKYDFLKSSDSSAKPQSIEINDISKPYMVSVNGYTPADSSQTLVKDMVSAKQGLIFQKVTTDLSTTSSLRIVEADLPTYIHPAAVLSGVSITIDPHISQIAGPTTLPSAYILIYSGNWTSANVTSPDASQSNLSYQSGSPSHVRFRVCPTGTCDSIPSTVDCTMVANEEQHNHDVFLSLLRLLTIPSGLVTDIQFPTCTQGNPYLCIAKGEDQSVTNNEVGLPDTPQPCTAAKEKAKSKKSPNTHTDQFNIAYANLHNCAASGMIVGS